MASTGELATAAMIAHSGDDGMARAGEVKGQLGHSVWWRKAPNRASERVNGEAMERAAAGGDRVDSLVTGARKGLTSGPACQREGGCEGARASAADGWGRAGSGGGRSVGVRAEMSRLGREGGARARGREVVGPDSAQPWGDFSFFFFFFYFSFISISYLFYLLFLLNKYLPIYF